MFKKDPLLAKSVSPHSPHNIIPQLIRKNTSLLDVGCNTGYLGKVLKIKKVIADGIDINEKALRIAKKFYRKVYKRDLYKAKLAIDKQFYDYIVFMDVLEHLPRPDLLLKDSLKYLKKNGKIIVSLPNAARLEIRLQLLFGSFTYTKGGIISEDHLRFFSKKSAIEMFDSSGYKVENIIPTGLGHQLKILPTLTAFQFIFVCQKKAH